MCPPYNEVMEVPCGGCGAPILLTNTGSIWKSDQTAYRIYHSDCFKNKEKEA